MADLIGKLYGNFRLVKLLGQGGFAQVYLAQHQYIPNIQVAVKVMNAYISKESEATFIDEAKTLAKLNNHAHILKILDFGIDKSDESPYLVMEYISYGILPMRRVVPLLEISSILSQLCSALEYAHNLNTIHRDVKPSNVLLRSPHEIVLSDFGIATVASSTRSHVTTNFSGTVAYSAPEQILGKVTKASDQYSVGVMLYEWLTGELPFKGTPNEIMMQHIQRPVTSLTQRFPSVTPSVEAVVLTALSKEPSERFTNMTAFSEAFLAVCRAIPSAYRVQFAPTIDANATGVQKQESLKETKPNTPVISSPVDTPYTPGSVENHGPRLLPSDSQQMTDRKPNVVSKVASQNPPKKNFWFLLGNGLIIGGAAIWLGMAILESSGTFDEFLYRLIVPFATYPYILGQAIIFMIFACLVGCMGVYGLLKNSHRNVTQWGTMLTGIILIVYSFLPVDFAFLLVPTIMSLSVFACIVYTAMVGTAMMLYKQGNGGKKLRILSCVGSIPIVCTVIAWWGLFLWRDLAIGWNGWSLGSDPQAAMTIHNIIIQEIIIRGGIVIMIVGLVIQFIASVA